jgi:hypothetical protein
VFEIHRLTPPLPRFDYWNPGGAEAADYRQAQRAQAWAGGVRRHAKRPRDLGVAAFVRDAASLRNKRTDEVASVGILVPHLRHIEFKVMRCWS